MSVLILDLKEVNSIRNQFIKSTNLFNNLKISKEYQSLSKWYVTDYEPQKTEYEIYVSMIDRLLWYMHISNIIAYNLNYSENIEIEHDFIFDDNAESCNPWAEIGDYYHAFGSLFYNISTNAGTIFLPAKFATLAEYVYSLVKKSNFFEDDLLLTNDRGPILAALPGKDPVKNTKWFVKSLKTQKS